ncbi:MAG: transposase [Planctomycetia bacterium]|nr:transposase [Planctomycetia bacterium]
MLNFTRRRKRLAGERSNAMALVLRDAEGGRIISLFRAGDGRRCSSFSRNFTTACWSPVLGNLVSTSSALVRKNVWRICCANSSASDPHGRNYTLARQTRNARFCRVFTPLRVAGSRLNTLLSREYKNPEALRLTKRLRKYRSTIFAFLHHADVPFDNNHAERSIRPAVIMRKNSYGNRSTDGSAAQSILMSIFRTLKQRGISPTDTLCSALRQFCLTGVLPLRAVLD